MVSKSNTSKQVIACKFKTISGLVGKLFAAPDPSASAESNP